MSSKTASVHLPPKFLSGSIMKHIWEMTSTSAIGLIGVFLVDFLDIFFLSMLDSNAIIAGIGFAATLSFFNVSISIGLTISMSALVSRMIGKGNPQQARRYVINVSVLTLIITSLLALVVWLNRVYLLSLLGASGPALDVASRYLQILLPSLPILATGMAMAAAIRAVGDAKLSMKTTLIGGGINAVLDPIFIFTLSMGVDGAAIASVIARIAVLVVAFYGVKTKHQLIKQFVFSEFVADLKPIFKVAGPAMLTNMATPIGNAIVIKAIAAFGTGYVAGYAIIGRVSMVAFGLIFALSGAIAPIFGQNYGAHHYQRIQQTLRDSLKFNAAYVVLLSIVLYLLQNTIIAMFKLEGDAAELMHIFCTWIALTFVFNGIQFVSNSAFNNLGKPMYATGFNVGKSTLGTLPFVFVGGANSGGRWRLDWPGGGRNVIRHCGYMAGSSSY